MLLVEFCVCNRTAETFHFPCQQSVFTGATPLSSRNALFVGEAWATPAPSRKIPLCTHRWTQHDGEFMHHLVLTGQGFSSPWHMSTPGRKKNLEIRCVFICFFTDVVQPQTDRLGFHWRSGRDLVSSVMDRPGVHGDSLFILAPPRAGREDKHFLDHSDTRLLCVSAGRDAEGCSQGSRDG